MSPEAPLELVQVDAFTDRPFRGNPAAVCVLPEDGARLEDSWMQNLAREMNLSETAFLRRRDDGDWHLRWFTPGAEVDLCGHATLASAHVLWQDGHVPDGADIRFHTLSGELTARRRPAPAQGGEPWIELDFPSQPATAETPPPELLKALGVGAPGKEIAWAGFNGSDWLLELASEEAVRSAEPDVAALSKLPARGVILTARSPDQAERDETPGDGYDFVSRFFAPAVGVDEDPVTGSAHCCLGPYWSARLGRDDLVGYQASQRGGRVRVSLRGGRALLSGPAVTVMRARWVADR